VYYEEEHNITSAIGVDEANFSPSIAGDCVCVACWLPLPPTIEGIKDSKQTTFKQRRKAFEQIQNIGLYCVVPASVSAISQVGVYRARNWAMGLAIKGLLELRPVEHILIDGKPIKLNLPNNVSTDFIIQGDEKSYLMGAASIVAKVYTDALFEGYGNLWPGYGINVPFDHGSLSKQHKEALRELGPTPVHRTRHYAPEWWRRILNGRCSCKPL
jgi:ribonuclease HII